MDEFKESTILLAEMLEEVKTLEGTLSGGQKLGIGGAALQCLTETRICLGNPKDQLIRPLTPALFQSVGFELNEVQKRQWKSYDFYYMTIPVNLFGAPGVQFSDLICDLDFGPKGEHESIIQALFPTSEWHEVLAWGAELSILLGADWKWKARVNLKDDEFAVLATKLPGSISTQVENKNRYKAWVAMHQYSFSIGRKEISAAGIGDSYCRWVITKPELNKVDTVQFGIVFKTEKSIHEIDLTASVAAHPHLPWLANHLRHLSASLSKKCKDVLAGETKIVIGDRERWAHLKLPL